MVPSRDTALGMKRSFMNRARDAVLNRNSTEPTWLYMYRTDIFFAFQGRMVCSIDECTDSCTATENAAAKLSCYSKHFIGTKML